MSLQSRDLIPNPFAGDESAARFAHRDVRHLSAAQIWGERVTLEAVLAHRITLRVRPRIVMGWPDIIDEEGWLIERVGVLVAEQRRRRGSSRA